MSGGEFAAIEARASAADDSRGPIEQAVMYRIELPTSMYDRILASQEDVPALLAAVRERDNTIARVRDIVESVHVSDDLDPDGYQVAGLIRAALDPQETE